MRMKPKGNAAIAIISGVLSSIIITLVITLIGTTLIHNGRAGESSGLICSAVSWFLSAFASCLIAGSIYKDAKVMIAVIAVSLYFAILLSLHILIFEGGFNNIIMGLLLTAAGSACSIWIQCGRKKGKKMKYNYKLK